MKTTVQQNTVQIRAVVTDSAGQFVDNLTKEDFVVTEDGVPQTVNASTMARSERKSDTRTPSQPTIPRAIVLLVDTAHISHNGMDRVRSALTHFLDEQKSDQDLVALMTSAGKPGVAGEFTTDPRKLKAESSKVKPGFTQFDSFLTPVLCGKVVQRQPQALSLASLIIDSEDRNAGSMQIPRTGNAEAEAVSKCRMLLLETASRRRALMTTIGAAVAKISALPGPHMIALFSEGFSMTAGGGDPAISEVRPAISSAVRSAVVIYTFDTRDTTASKQVNIESYSLAGEMLSARQDLQHGVALLAGQTGGDAFFNLDRLGDQLEEMLDSNQICYRLAYNPPFASDPRKYRNINVSVKGHPEYQVRTPKGYDMTDPKSVK